jgi:hypothetical protein
MIRHKFLSLAPALALLLGCANAAAATTDASRDRELPRLQSSAVIDGVLDEPAWSSALQVTDFYEFSPGDNTPAVVQTVGYLWYDAEALYVAFHCFDPRPEEIRAVFSDRDTVFTDQDVVQFDLDTRNEEKSSIIFRTNPMGVPADAIFSETTGLDDFAPDFSFDVAARITDEGWVAEFRVPFSSLRYSSDAEQIWGITMFRNYPREYRRQMTSLPIPRGANCWLCYNLKLTGMTDLPRSRYFLAVPYGSIQSMSTEAGHDTAADLGVDIKWIPNNNVTIDATINPDFAQVETDDPQITVNRRFALFLPEKRSFFLEGADLLKTPLDAVYTRTITSPAWGARVTGKTGESAYTFLLARDQGGGSRNVPGVLSSRLAPQPDDSIVAVGRWSVARDNSLVGLIFTDLETEEGSNRLFGPDFEWRPSAAHEVRGQFLLSSTRGELFDAADAVTDQAFLLGYRYSTPATGLMLEYQRIGHDFRAENGFIPQVGIESGSAILQRNFYPEGWLTLVEAGLGVDASVEIDDRTVSRSTYPYIALHGKWNSSLLLEYHANEKVRTDTRMLGYSYLQYALKIHPSERISNIALSGQLGEQADVVNGRVGRGGVVTLSARLRPSIHLATDIQAERRWIKIDAGDLLTADIARIKATYYFSSRSFLRAIGQYEKVRRDPGLYVEPVARSEGSLGGSVLYGYRFNWQTSFHVGYGDERPMMNDRYGEGSRSFFMKLVYLVE